MNCTICHKKITLQPSAAERARKDVTGNTTADYYLNLFTTHADCAIAQRSAGVSALIKRIYHV